MITIIRNVREQQIIELLQAGPHSVSMLAEKLNCSTMTIRRDLDHLASINIIKRHHGSAEIIPSKTPSIMTEEPKSHVNANEKEAIGIGAQYFIQPNMIIGIDSGSTAHAIVQNFDKNMPLTVITPSVRNSLYLCSMPNIQIIQLGGFVNHKNTSTLDSLSTDFIHNFNVDISFISSCAISPEGAFEKTITLVDSKKALASIAKKIVVIADSIKFGATALCLFLNIDKIDALITDNTNPSEIIDAYVNKGKEVIVMDTMTKEIFKHYNHS